MRLIEYNFNEVPIQFILNLPFSNFLEDNHAVDSDHTVPPTFTGKERDEETGYGYFGARYLDAGLLTGWLSVDPMADKYPSLSPYNYCAWNPVKLVDPDGNFNIDIHFKMLFDNLRTVHNINPIRKVQMLLGASFVADVIQQKINATHCDNYFSYQELVNHYQSAGEDYNANIREKHDIDAGVNLHTIADFYSHSNYVDLYLEKFPETSDVNSIPTLDEVLQDESGKYDGFKDVSQGELRTGYYYSRRENHNNPDPKSHNQMNKDKPWSPGGKKNTPKGNGNHYEVAYAVADKAITNYLTSNQ